jgi:hypothetical protein
MLHLPAGIRALLQCWWRFLPFGIWLLVDLPAYVVQYKLRISCISLLHCKDIQVQWELNRNLYVFVPPSQVLTFVIHHPIIGSERFMRTDYINVLSVLLVICVQGNEIVWLVYVYECGYYKQETCLLEAVFVLTVKEKVKLFLCMP